MHGNKSRSSRRKITTQIENIQVALPHNASRDITVLAGIIVDLKVHPHKQ
jgi:hypothetical protein